VGQEDRDWLLCPRTKGLLADLDPVLRSAIMPDDIQLRIMATHVVERGGKRLRPALLLLSASFGSGDRETLLRAAAAVELTHVATLYHDDVMDRAPMRRSGATTNSRWGNAAASFAGTYLFARATDLWASLGPLPNRLASLAAVELCTGQLHEVESAYNLDQEEAAHLKVLEQKTAPLFEMPCRIGGLLSGVREDWVDALTAYGRALGLAFQLADDALDLTGDAAQIGKAAANDLREGIYSLAVLRALRHQATGERLRAVLGHVNLVTNDVQQALHLVAESGAIAEAQELAGIYAHRATAALTVLPDSAATESLRRIAAYAIERSH